MTDVYIATALGEKIANGQGTRRGKVDYCTGLVGGEWYTVAWPDGKEAPEVEVERIPQWMIGVQASNGQWIWAYLDFGDDFANTRTKKQALAVTKSANAEWQSQGSKPETFRVVKVV